MKKTVKKRIYIRRAEGYLKVAQKILSERGMEYSLSHISNIATQKKNKVNRFVTMAIDAAKSIKKIDYDEVESPKKKVAKKSVAKKKKQTGRR